MTKIEIWPIDKVIPYPQNVKLHEPKQIEKIANSIEKFGWRGNPIIVNEQGVILAGHGRRLAAIKLKRTEVPVEVVKGLSEVEQGAYRLADNRVAISNLDTDMLIQELKNLDFDMGDIFDKKELAFLTADLGEIHAGAFIDDIDTAVEKQAAETALAFATADDKEVPIAKAIGFKAVKGRDERIVASFMAEIEASTGKLGAEAFVTFAANFK